MFLTITRNFITMHGSRFLVLTLTCISFTIYLNIFLLLRQSFRIDFDYFTANKSLSPFNQASTAEDFKENILSSSASREYLINTGGCRLPRTNLWPKFYADDWSWKSNPSPDCRAVTKLGGLTKDDLAKLKPPPSQNGCNLTQIWKNPDSDKNFLFQNYGKLESSLINVSNYEMFMMQCGSTLNFEATIPLHEAVKNKVKYWKEKPKKPPNVLILGFDTTSRMHVLRGMPKTLKVMEELGFLDFKGFHSIEPSTLPNLMAMLMGQTEGEAREACVPDWSIPFDNCSLVWKLFGGNQYVTVYNEDGEGSFHWGGRSGFKEKPTDYYLHPLFNAMDAIKEHHNTSLKEMDCVSSEGVPSFMLRYVRRFIQKFNSTPSFILNYHNDPFHNSKFALPTVDEDVAGLLNFLKTVPGYLDNTLIIMMGDHGDRYTFFSYDSAEAFIERALPPLFLKIPDGLLKTNPDFKTNALLNTKRLTTTFDLHHTFLHILSLSGLLPRGNGTSLEFTPSLPDRSSLFLPIPDSRDCPTVNIGFGFCVCNATEIPQPIKDPLFVSRLVAFAINELNEVVRRATKYRGLCRQWRIVERSVISANVFAETESHQTVLLKFMAWPEDSKFGVNVRIPKGTVDTNWRDIEVVSKFSRINKYGDQSHCIGFNTTEDKEMKQFCYCAGPNVKKESIIM